MKKFNTVSAVTILGSILLLGGCGKGDECSKKFIDDFNELSNYGMGQLITSKKGANEIIKKCDKFKNEHGEKTCKAESFSTPKDVSFEDLKSICDGAKNHGK